MNTVASLPAKLRWMIADASNLGVNERTIDLAVLEEAAAALATPAVEGASSAGEAVAWLRMTPNGEPDWAEDCIGSDDRFLDADLAADGYYLRPLTFADTTPPTPTNGVEAAIPLAEKWLSDRDMEATQEWCDGWNTCAQYFGGKYTAPPTPSAPDRGLNPPPERERDMLAEAIRNAAVKRGIVREDASLTGPMLLLLCEDLAQEPSAPVVDVPFGAIENGRVFADRLEAYPFESQGGELRLCSDWQEFRRCFDHLAEWTAALAGKDGAK